MKRIVTYILLLLCTLGAQAQNDIPSPSPWTVGLHGGWSSTTLSRYNASRIDEAYSALGGFEVGLQGAYAFNEWFSLRADLSFMQRSHRMDRNLNYLDPVYTKHRNDYLVLPVMADFSFGGEVVRGHLLAGGYAGYWLNDHRKGTTYWMTDYYVYFEDFEDTREFTDEDQRLTAGVVFGAGLSYSIDSRWELGLDALYYYDLTSHHRGYDNVADPRYLNTLSLTFNIHYKL
jgi:hypothetical protein